METQTTTRHRIQVFTPSGKEVPSQINGSADEVFGFIFEQFGRSSQWEYAGSFKVANDRRAFYLSEKQLDKVRARFPFGRRQEQPKPENTAPRFLRGFNNSYTAEKWKSGKLVAEYTEHNSLEADFQPFKNKAATILGNDGSDLVFYVNRI